MLLDEDDSDMLSKAVKANMSSTAKRACFYMWCELGVCIVNTRLMGGFLNVGEYS